MTEGKQLQVYLAVSAFVLVGIIGLPLVIESQYLLHIFVMTWMYAALALSYDLIAGHVGWLSLAHPTFFGVGAYVAALLSTRIGTSFLVDFAVAGLVSAILAYLVSKPLFRLAGVSFAIGTLGFSLIVQLVANNELWLTNGPMCLSGVPRPLISLPPWLHWQVSSLTDYYYLMFGILLVVVVLCSRLTTGRVGRTFVSIREDEALAAASGVNPLKYKAFAFVTGALIAGSVGAFYVHYSTIACPTDLSTYMTTALLIILFLGGVGRMRGVLLGAIVFTFVPEFLRMAQSLRLVLYGLLLLVTIVYMPEGLDGLLTRWLRKRRSPGTASGHLEVQNRGE